MRNSTREPRDHQIPSGNHHRLKEQTESLLRESTGVLEDASKSVHKSGAAVEGHGHFREDENIRDALRCARDAVDAATRAITVELVRYRRELEWGRPVVTFIGETNSGKSTIIEALTRGTGKRVGDGSKDFTKRTWSVRYDTLQLLDTPGIEGREGSLLDSVRDALTKAHVVVLVIGTNKELERATLEKIRRHARRAVQVFSVLNIRGKPALYSYQDTLENASTGELNQRIRHSIEAVFGSAYLGHLTTNGLLGLVASSRKLDRRFNKDRGKARDVFNGVEAARAFSRVDDLGRRLQEMAKDGEIVVGWSNVAKAIIPADDAGDSLGEAADAIRHVAQRWSEVVSEVQVSVQNRLGSTEAAVQSRVRAAFASLQADLLKEVEQAILNQEAADLQERAAALAEEAKNRLEREIKGQLEEMKTQMQGDLEELRDRIGLQLEIEELSIPGLSSVLAKLRLNITGELFDLASRAIGVVLTWFVASWAGIAMLVLVGFRKIWDWFFADPSRRQRQAIWDARAKIETAVAEHKAETLHRFSDGWNRQKKRSTNSSSDIGAHPQSLTPTVSDSTRLATSSRQ